MKESGGTKWWESNRRAQRYTVDQNKSPRTRQTNKTRSVWPAVTVRRRSPIKQADMVLKQQERQPRLW